MGIPKSTIEEIKSRCNIVDVITSYVPDLRRRGATYKCCCPFHQEKTPSFTVSENRQTYKCYGCGVSGDVFGFVMEYDKVDFVSAVQLLGDRVGVEVTFEGESSEGRGSKDMLLNLHKEAASYYHRMLLTGKSGQLAREYLKERDLPEDIVREFQIGFAVDKWDGLLSGAIKKGYSKEDLISAGLVTQNENKKTYDRFRNRLMFPICDHMGRVIGFSGRVMDKRDSSAKYVNSPETLIFRKSRVLFAFDKAGKAISEKQQAIVVEGQIDAIRCHQVGLTNVVASQGTALTEEHAQFLKRYTDEVVLVLDPDPAGIKAALLASELFIAHELSVRVAILPEEEDPDSLIKNQGRKSLDELLKQAPSALQYLIQIEQIKEDQSSDVGRKRVRNKVKSFISKNPIKSDQEDMIRTASKLLNISEAALKDDISNLPVKQISKADVKQKKEADAEKEKSEKQKIKEHEENVLKMLISHYTELKENRYLHEHCFADENHKSLFKELMRRSPEEILDDRDYMEKLEWDVLNGWMIQFEGEKEKMTGNDWEGFRQSLGQIWKKELAKWAEETKIDTDQRKLKNDMKTFRTAAGWKVCSEWIDKRLIELE